LKEPLEFYKKEETTNNRQTTEANTSNFETTLEDLFLNESNEYSLD